jgi:hypothetical protein
VPKEVGDITDTISEFPFLETQVISEEEDISDVVDPLDLVTEHVQGPTQV